MSRVDMYGGKRIGGYAKRSADYSPVSTDSTRCDGCAHFRAPDACQLVRGEIAPGGWCRLWEKKR